MFGGLVEGDAGGGGGVERVDAGGHGDACVGVGGVACAGRQSVALVSEDDGDGPFGGDALECSFERLGLRRWIEGDGGVSERAELPGAVFCGGPCGEGDAEGVAHADSNALSVEGVAAGGGSEDGAGAERGGVAEDAPQVVVIGEVFDGDDEAGGVSAEEVVGIVGGCAFGGGDEAAVDVEAGDGIHDGLGGLVDGTGRGRGGEVGGVEGGVCAEDGGGLEAAVRGEEDGDDQAALGEEEAFAVLELGVLEIAERGDSGVAGVVDGDGLA